MVDRGLRCWLRRPGNCARNCWRRKALVQRRRTRFFATPGILQFFVVAAYPRGVLERHDAIHPKARYDEIRALSKTHWQRAEPRVIDDSVGSIDPWFVCPTGEALLLEAESKCQVCPLRP